ncbi:hypothetical protein ACFFK0_12425 [Paenibacillus chartarius]|uniref:Polysaccharide pyruvyl transferase domain-containing protein n=1 Tax=Paenibacillus chartarius TaxID=747481 RepID=A0ABV6DKR7_9BACL
MRHEILLFSDEESNRILNNGNSKVLLLGGYLGYSNFGDILQLKGAIKFHKEKTGLEPIIICELECIYDESYVEKIKRWFGVNGIVFISKNNYEEASLPGLTEVIESDNINNLHLYGGGILNQNWGQLYLDIVSGLFGYFDIKSYVISGQQLDNKFIDKLVDHFHIYQPTIVGTRDQNSLELLKSKINSVDLQYSFDDTTEVFLDIASYHNNSSDEKPNTIFLHMNTSSYTVGSEFKAAKQTLLDNIGRVIEKYPTHTIKVLHAYEDQRFSVKDTLESIAEMEDDFPFHEYVVVDIAKLALEYNENSNPSKQAFNTIRGVLGLSSSYHTTLFLNFLRIPCYLVSLNPYYVQKKAGLGNPLSLDEFIIQPTITDYSKAIEERKAWINKISVLFYKSETQDKVMIGRNNKSKTTFSYKDDYINKEILLNNRWQKEQTDLWWVSAEKNKHDLEWQKQQTHYWWEIAQKSLADFQWQKEQTDHWWQIAQKSLVDLQWQKEQTDHWWQIAQKSLADLQWQQEQTDYWWNIAEEHKKDIAWQREQTDHWWTIAQSNSMDRDWQKEQTDYWWSKYQEAARDLEWQTEQTSIWWKKYQESINTPLLKKVFEKIWTKRKENKK